MTWGARVADKDGIFPPANGTYPAVGAPDECVCLDACQRCIHDAECLVKKAKPR